MQNYCDNIFQTDNSVLSIMGTLIEGMRENDFIVEHKKKYNTLKSDIAKTLINYDEKTVTTLKNYFLNEIANNMSVDPNDLIIPHNFVNEILTKLKSQSEFSDKLNIDKNRMAIAEIIIKETLKYPNLIAKLKAKIIDVLTEDISSYEKKINLLQEVILRAE